MSDPPVVIGVVGPHDLVDRVALGQHGAQTQRTAIRLVPAAYRQESEAVGNVERVQASTDALLFTGPLPYDLVRQSGRLMVPASYISLSGDALYAALIRCVVDHAGDLRRVSVDTVSESDVHDAYGDIDVAVDGVHVRAYQGPESADALAAFHTELFRTGETTAALTGIQSVHRRLVASGIPAVRVLPSAAATRQALHAAVLMGRGSQLEESQIAIGIVTIPALLRSSESNPHQWQHELRLSAHRVLIHEGRQVGATVLPLDGGSFIVVATSGSLAEATRDWQEPPFVARLHRELGLVAQVGVGLGRTAEEAETHARAAVGRGPDQGFVVGQSDSAGVRPADPVQDPGGRDSPRTRVRHTYDQILRALGPRAPDAVPVVLDVGMVEDLLGVQERSARRTLRSLAEAGLAWPLPLDTSGGPGRPRQRYRLLPVPDADARHEPDLEERA